VELFVNTIAALMTVAILSFLFRDNPLYKFAEHLVVGVSMGYWVVILHQSSVIPKLVQPVVRTFTGRAQSPLDPLVIVPALLGILLFSRFVPRVSWLARIPMAFILGVGSGAAVPLLLQVNVIQQLYPTVSVFLPGAHGIGVMVNNVLVLIGVICGLAYFFFSSKHTGTLGLMSRVGIWILMIGFGASFGYTVMSRISLLYGRMNFMVYDWARPLLRSIF
jgi:hypothetical protein